jgi:hypothetical protein
MSVGVVVKSPDAMDNAASSPRARRRVSDQTWDHRGGMCEVVEVAHPSIRSRRLAPR